MRFLDLFSEIGGFRAGLEMSGHTCIGHCQIDKFSNKSYIAMHNHKEDEWFEEDIRNIKSEQLPYADIWTFEFTCQDTYQSQGNKRGLAKEKLIPWI